MNPATTYWRSTLLFAVLLICSLLLVSTPTYAEKLAVSPAASATLEKIYSFDLDAATTDARHLQEQHPGDPVGYLLEAEARWWMIWCLAADYRYGMTTAQHRTNKLPGDDRYLELSAQALSIAQASLKERETGEMQLYAGMAEASLARLYGLRNETRATARAGIRAREHLLRALQLNRDLADADFGLGLYNYYVDTLSSFVKFLSFFMGIPGGNKHEGIRQLQHAMSDGMLTPAAARFYLALDLHKYDQQYEEALAIIGPLAEKYPSNPLFQLARGDLYGKLARKEQAIGCYRAVLNSGIKDDHCRVHLRELALRSLAAQGITEPR
jgi:tetratricopeptide (TPR) repeat protein